MGFPVFRPPNPENMTPDYSAIFSHISEGIATGFKTAVAWKQFKLELDRYEDEKRFREIEMATKKIQLKRLMEEDASGILTQEIQMQKMRLEEERNKIYAQKLMPQFHDKYTEFLQNLSEIDTLYYSPIEKAKAISDLMERSDMQDLQRMYSVVAGYGLVSKDTMSPKLLALNAKNNISITALVPAEMLETSGETTAPLSQGDALLNLATSSINQSIANVGGSISGGSNIPQLANTTQRMTDVVKRVPKQFTLKEAIQSIIFQDSFSPYVKESISNYLSKIDEDYREQILNSLIPSEKERELFKKNLQLVPEEVRPSQNIQRTTQTPQATQTSMMNTVQESGGDVYLPKDILNSTPEGIISTIQKYSKGNTQVYAPDPTDPNKKIEIIVGEKDLEYLNNINRYE